MGKRLVVGTPARLCSPPLPVFLSSLSNARSDTAGESNGVSPVPPFPRLPWPATCFSRGRLGFPPLSPCPRFFVLPRVIGLLVTRGSFDSFFFCSFLQFFSKLTSLLTCRPRSFSLYFRPIHWVLFQGSFYSTLFFFFYTRIFLLQTLSKIRFFVCRFMLIF